MTTADFKARIKKIVGPSLKKKAFSCPPTN